MTHIVITTPRIMKTQAHTNKATVTGRVFDEDDAQFAMSGKKTVRKIKYFVNNESIIYMRP